MRIVAFLKQMKDFLNILYMPTTWKDIKIIYVIAGLPCIYSRDSKEGGWQKWSFGSWEDLYDHPFWSITKFLRLEGAWNIVNPLHTLNYGKHIAHNVFFYAKNRISALDIMFNYKGLVNDNVLGLYYFFSGSILFNLVFIVTFTFILIIFLKKNEVTVVFINKLLFGYFFFFLVKYSFTIFILPLGDYKSCVENFYQIFFAKKGPYSLFENNLGTIWDLVVSPGIENTFSNLFFLYSLLFISIFLYGISDRFFITKSFEIEYTFILLFIHLAAVILFYVNNFIDIIIALEIITLASYVLIGFERKNRFSTFGSVQYFILGSIPSGMLILGAAFLYRNWGLLALNDFDFFFSGNANDICNERYYWDRALKVRWKEEPLIESYYALLNTEYDKPNEYLTGPTISESVMRRIHINHNHLRLAMDSHIHNVNQFYLENKPKYIQTIKDYDAYFLNNDNSFSLWEDVFIKTNNFTFLTILGIFFILFNLFFKITAAPFHFWAPSVYSKGPIASVTFLSIFFKIMLFFLFFKFSLTFLYPFYLILTPFFLVIAFLSILFGILGAFTEKVIKRFFVYSSMGHVGFMLIGLAFPFLDAASATFHYLPIYVISSFIMWFILLHIGKKNVYILNLKKMRLTDPQLAIIFSLLIFSMSGIPPFGGFFVKLNILYVLMEHTHFYWVFFILVLNLLTFFYYLRVIKIIFFEKQKDYAISLYKNDRRLYLIIFLFLALSLYLFFMKKPILYIQDEALRTLW